MTSIYGSSGFDKKPYLRSACTDVSTAEGIDSKHLSSALRVFNKMCLQFAECESVYSETWLQVYGGEQ
jgi:hypothetical protein